jgi:FkbM family methyltransferase
MYQFKHIDQSSWIGEWYNQLDFPNKKESGYLVEIGVGNVIDYTGRDIGAPIPLEYTRLGSNTSELLDLGWKGLYVEPVSEFLLQCSALHKNNLDRLTLLNCAAGDKDEELVIGDGESLVSNSFNANLGYIRRTVQCKPTNAILDKFCPTTKINLLSLDVEGFEDRVLRSIDFDKYQFQMMIIEIDKVSADTVGSIIPNYYEKVADDGLNALYLNRRDAF